MVLTASTVCTRHPAGSRYQCDVTVFVVAENAWRGLTGCWCRARNSSLEDDCPVIKLVAEFE